MNWYLAVLKKYADFSGRARRKEFWMFTLINTIIALVLFMLFTVESLSSIVLVLSIIYLLATFIPNLAVTVRRLHDTNRSGWMLFVSCIPVVGYFIFLYFLCNDSTPGDNLFGGNPKV
ncbi:MAG: Inner membrane protein YhaI [Candidatus Erwinia impunctatus]|nr:Inner membrane protein YhaI [Culicoides impunctatus]